jgi:mevalonate kinase
LLQTLTVSNAGLDARFAAARGAGALGAKMSGGGRGGNMIALARDDGHAASVADALRAAGATRVYRS